MLRCGEGRVRAQTHHVTLRLLPYDACVNVAVNLLLKGPTMATDPERVLATLDEYAEAYCAKDLDRLMAIFVDGEHVSLIGTGSDELCSGRQAVASIFSRNFNDATAKRFEWGWNDVVVHGNAATVAMSLVIHLNSSDHRR
jgi:ketosteroid isomerase-like protein